MNRLKTTTLLGLAALSTAALAPAADAAVIAQYTFLGNSYASSDLDVNSAAGTFTENLPGNSALGGGGIAASTHGIYQDVGNPAPEFFIKPGNISEITNEALSVSTGTYLHFTVTPSSGYTLDLTSFSFDLRSGLGYALRTSADGFASTVGSAGVGTATYTTNSISLSAAAFQDLSEITLRLYVWNPTGNTATGNGSRYSLDNFIVEGETLAAVPEPATIGLLGAAGALLLGRKRRV